MSRPASRQRLCVRANARKEGVAAAGAASAAETSKQACDDVYPRLETDSLDAGLLPVRQPGDFPVISEDAEEAAPYDPLRDGPLRYLGYANECGEAFAAWLPPGGVPFSYAVAITYVLVDTVDKGKRAYEEAKVELSSKANLDGSVDIGGLTKLLAFERALDTVVWQMLASVFIPGYTIHTVVWFAHQALSQLEVLDPVKQAVAQLAPAVSMQADTLMALGDKSLPTAIGLAAIPFIVHPIDNTVHWVMNRSMRPAMRKMICSRGGALAGLDVCNENCDVPAGLQSSTGSAPKQG